MGRYDVLDREYFGQPSNMADLIQVGIYRNRVSIDASKLVRLEGRYPSLQSVSGAYERDAISLCEEHRLKYGLEIETYSDYGMARRELIYDAGEYEKERLEYRKWHDEKRDYDGFEARKSGVNSTDKNCPILNIVLFLGMGRYKGQRALSDNFYDLSSELQPFVQGKIQDYSFTVIEADYVNPYDFKTELKQFFMAMQARNNKKKLLELFESEEFERLTEETQKIIAIHLDNKKIIRNVIEEKQNMCKAIRDLIRDSKKEGKEEGKEEGRCIEIYESVQEGDYGVERGAEKMNLTITMFIERMKKAGYMIP